MECGGHSGDWWCYFYKIPCERIRVTKQEDGSARLPGFSSILDYNTIHVICADPERGKKKPQMWTQKIDYKPETSKTIDDIDTFCGGGGGGEAREASAVGLRELMENRHGEEADSTVQDEFYRHFLPSNFYLNSS